MEGIKVKQRETLRRNQGYSLYIFINTKILLPSRFCLPLTHFPELFGVGVSSRCRDTRTAACKKLRHIDPSHPRGFTPLMSCRTPDEGGSYTTAHRFPRAKRWFFYPYKILLSSPSSDQEFPFQALGDGGEKYSGTTEDNGESTICLVLLKIYPSHSSLFQNPVECKRHAE